MSPLFTAAGLMMILITGCAYSAQSLQDFLKQPDSAFQWEEVSDTTLSGGVSMTEFQMTSQRWKSGIWTHHMAALKPKEMKSNPTALLMISGDYNIRETEALAVLAERVGLPLFVVWDIPNQPLYGDLGEDALISYTFQQYLETGEDDWPLLLPMTKGAVRAMDAAQEFAREKWDTQLDGFVVTGASKRGWTTWLTGAHDQRVKAIAPMVFDVLNMEPQMKHQVLSFGGYSEQIGDYTERGLQDILQSEEGRKLAKLVDPYEYRERLSIPKLAIYGTNDPYWPVDAANLYYPDLIGPKNVLYVPNSGHGLDDRMRVFTTLAEFWLAADQDKLLPKPEWTYESPTTSGEGVRLTIRPGVRPRSARLWMASAPTRDFREARWSSQPLTEREGVFSAEVKHPEKGFTALFGEVEYRGGVTSYTLSTQVHVLGDKR